MLEKILVASKSNSQQQQHTKQENMEHEQSVQQHYPYLLKNCRTMVLSGASTDLPVHAVGSGAKTWILSITSFPPLHVHLSHCSIYCCIHFYSNGTGNHLTFTSVHRMPKNL